MTPSNAARTAPAIFGTDRHLPLQGGCNFRDIGGYDTVEGRTVRRGRVYRTGVLSYLTPQDHGPLLRLGVRAICDLRRAEEREREPNRWPDASVQSLSWGDGVNMPTIRGFVAQRAPTADGMRDAMIDLYRALPAWMGPRIRGLFDCVASSRTPVIVHCAAGKDRTGVAVAVLLSALGVRRDTVMADYLLTNDVGNFEQFIHTRRHTHPGLADAHHPLLSMPEDIRRVLFSADADFLGAAFEQIDRDYGGVDAYLAQVAGIDDAVRRDIGDQLLT